MQKKQTELPFEMKAGEIMKTSLFNRFIRGLALILTLLTVLTCTLSGCEFRDENADDGGENKDDSGDATIEYYKRTEKKVSDVQYNALDYIKFPNPSDVVLHKSEIDSIVAYEMAKILLSGAEYETFNEDGSAEVRLFDSVNITYTGRAKDESIELDDDTMAGMDNSSDERGYDLVIGSQSFIGEYFGDDETKYNKGFEDQLIGAKVGETIDITVTFPDDYGSRELCGVVVIFTVKINSIKRAKLDTFVPTDEQCKKYTSGEYETIDEFRAAAEEGYTGKYAYNLLYNKIEVIGSCKEIVDIYVDDYIHQYVIYTNGEKITQEQYDTAYSEAYEAMYENIAAQAESKASDYIISNYIVEYFNITLSEDEFNDEVQKIWDDNEEYYKSNGMTGIEDFIEYFGRDYIEMSFKNEKLISILPERITIVE